MFEQFHGAEFLMEDPEAKHSSHVVWNLKVPCHVVPLDTKPSGVNSVHIRTPDSFRILAHTTDFHVCLFVGVQSVVFQLFFLHFCTHTSSPIPVLSISLI